MSDFDAWLAGLEVPASPAPQVPVEVQETAEFRRIRDAARVDWKAEPRLARMAELLTAAHRTPSGEQVLRVAQAAILWALHDFGRTYVPLRTAGGKTLPGFLAPEIVQAKRPLLIVPAKMLNSGKTHREHAKYRQHWRLRPIMSIKESRSRRIGSGVFSPLRVVSYEALGRTGYEDALANWNPDLVALDEFHKCKDPSTAVTRRLSRFVRTFRPLLLLMSGSALDRSIGEVAHLLRWCFGDGAPIPRDWNELQHWRWALDEKVQEAMRVGPGALLGLSPPIDDDQKFDDRQKARRRFARRVCTTPGVIASGDDLPSVVLTARVEKREPSKAMLDVVSYMQTNWETPCGDPIVQATDQWRHEREVSCGFYYRWDVQPPPEWRWARKMWSAYVREKLSHSRTYDSPAAIANAIDAGKLKDDGGTLAEWRRVKHLFDPEEHQETVWICDQTLTYCGEWLEKERGICWVYHVAFGKRLAELTGVPYFAAGGKAGKVPIDTHKGPAIASIKAVNEGFNLHEHHYKNLVSTCPTTNRENEQLISRTHRDGQPEDVEIIYLVTLEGDARALAQARADAMSAEGLGGLPQRLNVATWIDE